MKLGGVVWLEYLLSLAEPVQTGWVRGVGWMCLFPGTEAAASQVS